MMMQQEQPDSNWNKIYTYMFVAMTMVILFVVGLMFLDNQQKKSSYAGYQLARQRALEEREINVTVDSSKSEDRKLTSDELDIWTLPATGRKKESQQETPEKYQTTTDTPATKEETMPSEIEKQLEANRAEENQTEVKLTDLSFQRDGNLLTAYKNGKVVSTQGTELSWRQGTVNMKRLKNAGCDFVMLQVGERGYCSGKVVMDENFQKNLENALAAELKVGIVFTTNATTKDEILEEADTILTSIRGYTIDYPIALKYQQVEDDLSRADGLTKEERTDLAVYFAKEIQDSHLTPCIYGTKEFLEENLALEDLSDYELWISTPEENDLGQNFSMWHYGQGLFQGVTKETNFILHLESN